jgi:hypothetical protein
MHMKIVFYMVIDGSTSMIKHTPRIFIVMLVKCEEEGEKKCVQNTLHSLQ